ncbi:MAG: alpha-D-ribose 1-methylphosphonate 5-triphosphate diphosphatase [Ktedonobacteraceae bacterium]|nr:alpha-D-ribose 1-methylphosphonate 5-triphosphate diphosphatase [Ktedonobacteraceae bacterium]
MQILIHNATLVLPHRLIQSGWLLIEDGHIAGLGESTTCPDPSLIEQSLDAAAHFLMPGLIDLHSDAIEKLVEPRPGVYFALPVALEEADWRLAGCGITTEFHAVSLDDNEFGVRSDSFIHELSEAIAAEASTLLVRHKIHARLELSSQGGLHTIRQMVAQGTIGMLSIMDHSPGQGQYTTLEAYRAYMMRTTNRTVAEVDAILARKRRQAAEIPRRIEAVTRLAREAGLAISTHDDDSSDKVEQWPALGVSLSEFPTTLEAAARAHEVGLAVCMGAPNALRGQSSSGHLSALDAIKAGIAGVLCADYYPAAMLGAVFKLATAGVLPLPQAVRLVTLNPARAVGLGNDFGSLEPGKVADLIVVALNDCGLPVVQRVFVDGREKVARAFLSSARKPQLDAHGAGGNISE